MAEEIKDENCEVLRMSIVNIQVCSKLSEEETLKWLREACPAGTTNNWGLQCKESEDYLAPVQCADDPERKHYIFIC